MIMWKQLRISLLGITFSSVILVLGHVILYPTKDQHQVSPFVFPEEVPLPKWQQSTTSSLPQSNGNHPELIAQKHYQYIQNNLSLDTEMRYLTDGDVPKFIHDYTSISSSAVVHQREGVGYYGLGVYQQQAYLSACINPQGDSTFTYEQFNKNQDLYETRPQHLLSWLLGQETLQDRRCLWTHLSVPLKDSSPEATYLILEKAWFSWEQWWRPRFPKP